MKTAQKKNTNNLWMVTGINRITGLREQCSMAGPKNVAEQFYEAWKKLRVRNKAYTHLRIEPYTVINDNFSK